MSEGNASRIVLSVPGAQESKEVAPVSARAPGLSSMPFIVSPCHDAIHAHDQFFRRALP